MKLISKRFPLTPSNLNRKYINGKWNLPSKR